MLKSDADIPGAPPDFDLQPDERAILLGLEVGLRQHATLLFKTLTSAQVERDGLMRFETGLHNALHFHEKACERAIKTFLSRRAEGEASA